MSSDPHSATDGEQTRTFAHQPANATKISRDRDQKAAVDPPCPGAYPDQ